MSRSPSPRRVLASALTVALAGSLVTTATATSAQAHNGSRTVHVKITKYHNVKMPDVIRPGVHRFVIRSTRDAGLQIIRPRAGYTKREAARDIAIMFDNPRAMRRFERRTVLIGGAESRAGEASVAWMRLVQGRYWALDTHPRKTLARKIQTFRATGQEITGRLPRTATVRAVNHVDWAARPQRIPSSGLLRFRNASDAVHVLALVKLKRGKTMADFDEWVEQLKQGNETPPPVNFDIGTGSGVIDPGRTQSFRYDLPPGRYVMVCWWPDADMGMLPHFMMGMYRGITLR